MKTIYFYASVGSKRLFSIQSFLRNDILILRELGYRVVLCNSFLPFFCFWRYQAGFLYFYRYSLVPAFISRLFGKKVYFTGGIDYLDPNFATPWQRSIQALLFRLCNLLSTKSILVSSADMQHIQHLYNGKLPNNCCLCFHGIDIEQFRFNGNFSDKENSYCSIAWMGGMDNIFRKGIDRSIDIFAEIVKLQPDAKLYLAGYEGIGSRYVCDKITNLGLNGRCEYLGTVSETEKIALLQQCRYYFQLSKSEGFGLASIEALAAGCIVIHSGKGGLRDAVGNYGYKVDIDHKIDVPQLVAEIQCEAANIERIKQGIQYVFENFSVLQRMQVFKYILKV